MAFLKNLACLDNTELYSTLVQRIQQYCSNNKSIQNDDCDLIRLSNSENIESEIDKSDLSNQGKSIVTEVFKVHQKAIWNATIDKIATSHIGSHLVAFDWDVSLVLSNSFNQNVMQPLLKLTFLIEDKNKKIDPETLIFELNKEELAQFIATLEDARKSLSTGSQL